MYEATKSWTAKRHGIINYPNELQLKNMQLWAENIFEPLRLGLGNYPIYLASFLRVDELNTIIGGATNSQHICENGASGDIDVDNSPFLYNYQVFEYIRLYLDFDQLIWEFGDKYNPDWVHASYKQGNNRKQILVAYKENGKTKYKKWSP
jgi:hypothetical protein